MKHIKIQKLISNNYTELKNASHEIEEINCYVKGICILIDKEIVEIYFPTFGYEDVGLKIDEFRKDYLLSWSLPEDGIELKRDDFFKSYKNKVNKILTSKKEEKYYDQCYICEMKDEQADLVDNLIANDGSRNCHCCKRKFHNFCLQRPLLAIWYCANCEYKVSV